MSAREEKPDIAPDWWQTCDAGFCQQPAVTWVYDDDAFCWLPACRQCALREAM